MVQKIVTIFTDGSCKGNPGPGGWAALLRYNGTDKLISGAQIDATNNQMELLAAIKGLESLKGTCSVKLYTDSKYLQDGITKWVYNWIKKNWHKSDGGLVKNKELWQQLIKLVEKHDISWHWVKAHSGHHENELVDEAAKSAIDDMLENKLRCV